MTAGFTFSIRSAKSAGCCVVASAACTGLDRAGICLKVLGPPSRAATASAATDPISTRRRRGARGAAGRTGFDSFMLRLQCDFLLLERAGRRRLRAIIGHRLLPSPVEEINPW